MPLRDRVNDLATRVAAEIKIVRGLINGKADLNHGHALTDSNITGVLPAAQMPTHNHTAAQTTSGTFAAARLPAATETAIGAVERATAAEARGNTDTTRYISPGILHDGITGAIETQADVQAAGDARWSSFVRPANSMFDKLKQGVLNPTLDTRVVVLGSSTMASGSVSVSGLGVAERLGFRSGMAEVLMLTGVASNVTAGSMRWWNGALGGSTSANYYPTYMRTHLARVQPHYVLHMVGSNDWASGVSPATYQSNMNSMLNLVESAVPGVINIVIHQQGRMDISNPANPWSAFSAALANVANMKPAQRYFIDADAELFGYMDMTQGNRWGLVSPDNVHMGDQGHRVLADVIGKHLGIPSETNIIPPATYQMPGFPTTTIAAGGTLRLWTLNLPPAAYPRNVRFGGTIGLNNNEVGGQAHIFLNVDGKNSFSRVQAQTTLTGRSVELERVVPPGRTVPLIAEIQSNFGQTYVSGNGEFSYLTVTVTPT